MILLNMLNQNCKLLELSDIDHVVLIYKVNLNLILEMVEKNNTFNKLNIQMTKYHIYYHKVNLSKLMDLHNKEFQFES